MDNDFQYNNYGKFNDTFDEYEIFNTNTPLPWCNILANPRFGTVISTYGTVYSFYKNASEFKLTSWCNDWANFKKGEEYKGIFDTNYNLTYGFGYVKVTGENNNIIRNMDIFVPLEDDVKIHLIEITNQKGLDKEIRLEFEPDMVLGVAKEISSQYILTKIKNDTLMFKNTYNEYFSDVITYVKCNLLGNEDSATVEYDITLKKVVMKIIVKAGKTRKLALLFGADTNQSKIKEICEKYNVLENIISQYDNTKKFWREKVIQNFKTGDKNLDILANGWLLYQTIVCRLFARTSLYQAGGAFGFRDQLQDTLALINIWPDLVKEQIIKHASKQFELGDVLHWWHEHSQKGIRTYFSDDYLWLPYTLSEYIEKTSDLSILDIKVPFLEDKKIEKDNKERYDYFERTEEEYSIYDHAIRAIKYGLSRKGKNGLLNIGGGDWNDGFSNINGQSVWLTFFMMDILYRFSRICELKIDEVNKMHFMSERHVLKHSVIDTAFNGEYFARAFYEDGASIGNKDSEDCKIDLISQAWAAIALKDYPDCKNEIQSALNSAEKYLVDRKLNIVKLLYPPFDNPRKNPGYIKAYVPGVRENGGQYTHAAIWLAKAYFDIGNKKKGLDILKIINPIEHSNTHKKALKYMVEPYVLAADVYSNVDHEGRGGWTWYTGSAAWMYKVIEDNLYTTYNNSSKTSNIKSKNKSVNHNNT